MGHSTGLLSDLTVYDNLKLRASLWQGNLKWMWDEYFSMYSYKTRLNELSYGYQKRVALLSALLCPYTLWLFDEPLSGLSEELVLEFYELLNRDHILVVTSHVPLVGFKDYINM